MSRASSRTRQPSPMAARRLRPYDSDDTVLGSDHTAIHAGRVAVITGGASGIGRAAAKKFARHGLKICIADVNVSELKEAEAEVAQIVGADNVLAIVTNVAILADVEKLRDEAVSRFGEINVLLIGAGITKSHDGKVGTAFGNIDAWKEVLDVNLGGVINVIHVFTPVMINQENPSLIIATGSKQGITNPPGNAAYNVSKAGVRFVAENLAHELRERGSHTTAHLFVPGWTHTGMTGAREKPKPDGAWTPEETVRYMFDHVRLGEFYVVCPDNETSSELDRLRMKWAAEDVAEGRPALSRWHPEWKGVYEEYVSHGLSHPEEA